MRAKKPFQLALFRTLVTLCCTQERRPNEQRLTETWLQSRKAMNVRVMDMRSVQSGLNEGGHMSSTAANYVPQTELVRTIQVRYASSGQGRAPHCGRNNSSRRLTSALGELPDDRVTASKKRDRTLKRNYRTFPKKKE